MLAFLSAYFGPLNKNACVYFLIISVIFFVALILVLFSELLYIVQHFRTLNLRMITNGVLILFNIFIAYFVNRLLYNMCTKSLSA